MNLKDIERKQIIVCNYLQSLIDENSTESWKIKAEYSTNDNDDNVAVVQEQTGEKQVFFEDTTPLYNYYNIDIFGKTIQECKNLSLLLGNLIGTNNIINVEYQDESGKNWLEKWQIIFKQFTNPQTLEYQDLRRVSYNMTMQCIVSRVYRKERD